MLLTDTLLTSNPSLRCKYKSIKKNSLFLYGKLESIELNFINHWPVISPIFSSRDTDWFNDIEEEGEEGGGIIWRFIEEEVDESDVDVVDGEDVVETVGWFEEFEESDWFKSGTIGESRNSWRFSIAYLEEIEELNWIPVLK